jgi:hypothetical protein
MEMQTGSSGLSEIRIRKRYFQPEIIKTAIDPSFTLMNSSNTGPELPPRPGSVIPGVKVNDSPFQPPFNKPFG